MFESLGVIHLRMHSPPSRDQRVLQDKAGIMEQYQGIAEGHHYPGLPERCLMPMNVRLAATGFKGPIGA